MKSKHNKRTDFIKLTADELFALKPGDSFRVYWAKDDNYNDVRFDYELFSIRTISPSIVTTADGEEWVRDLFVGENCYDTSRGYAYFYRGNVKCYGAETKNKLDH